MEMKGGTELEHKAPPVKSMELKIKVSGGGDETEVKEALVGDFGNQSDSDSADGNQSD